ncbi:MOSC domain-containing protein [Actinokineospora inagensis]|uniref:MOSC domain-containing protein n=1 Tax=Actinokineospora inagensis TaxID=103730 RepID=UPI001B7F9EC9|nr:MOSC N-terminal beta barrel domain-containing protein [Actinokineospora inagensis]
MATVSALTYYPVKGFHGISVSTADVVRTGLREDRAYMVVDAADGTFLSQRKVPAMAVVHANPTPDGLRLSVAGYDDILVEPVVDGPRREVSLFNKWFGPAVDQGDLAAKWCSEVLDRDVRLVRVPPDHDRDGWGLHPGKVGFGDAHAVLVTSDSSLVELNTRITAAGGTPIPMDRFRPNIVITGWPTPHTEDTAATLTIGPVHLGYSTEAIRCAVPTVDQSTGERKGPEPTRTLATYRRHPTRPGVTFGAKYATLTPGPLTLGDEVHLTRR